MMSDHYDDAIKRSGKWWKFGRKVSVENDLGENGCGDQVAAEKQEQSKRLAENIADYNQIYVMYLVFIVILFCYTH